MLQPSPCVLSNSVVGNLATISLNIVNLLVSHIEQFAGAILLLFILPGAS